jgi:hypothetical protein
VRLNAPIPAIPPGQIHRVIFDQLTTRYDSRVKVQRADGTDYPAQYSVRVSYRDYRGKGRQESYTLNLDMFSLGKFMSYRTLFDLADDVHKLSDRVCGLLPETTGPVLQRDHEK